MGVTSLPRLSFVDVIDRVRVYESSMSYVPDSFLTSLRSVVVYLEEFDVAIGAICWRIPSARFASGLRIWLIPLLVRPREGTVSSDFYIG